MAKTTFITLIINYLIYRTSLKFKQLLNIVKNIFGKDAQRYGRASFFLGFLS